MANTEVLDLVCIAIEAADYYLRDVRGMERDLGKCISEAMSAHELDDEHREAISRLAGYLVSFAGSVRISEKINKPIVPIFGQNG